MPAKNFLFTTFEGGGSVPPILHVAKKLIARGHRVRVMSDACNRPEAEAAGATFIPWTRAPSKPHKSREFDTWDDWSQADPAEGFANIMQNVLAGPALAYADDVIEELQREPADLVVALEMLFGPPMACEAIKQKFVLLTANIPLFPIGPGFLPLGPGFAPPRNAEEAAMIAEVAAASEAMLNAFVPTLNVARQKLGLAPISRVVEQHAPAEAILLGTARAFDFAPEVLPPKVAYVGPQLGEPQWAQAWTSPFPAEDKRPLALVSFSTTFQNHAGVLQNVIDAIAPLPMKAVVTLGGSINPDEVRGADNVALIESAPHGAVMREAALVVTHGGHGTLIKALAHELPMLILPHGRDQEDNAVRVTARRAGIKLDRTSDVEAIRTALSRLLQEPSFSEGARALGAQVALEAANSPVIEMLEKFAQADTPAAPPRLLTLA